MKKRRDYIPARTALFIITIYAIIMNGCNGGTGRQNPVYTNPVLHSDYSDPDVVRSGDDYYMVASSFNCVPGLPVLHSTDLITWKLTGYALERLQPEEYYSSVRHGGGVWAPCIRIHNSEFYIFYPDPDHGIFMIKASDPAGSWSAPVIVMKGRGLIDPSPLWDDDGNAYLTYAFAGSRAGVKSVLMVIRMKPDGAGVTGDPVMVFDGHDDNPTVEGPKFYKRNGWYYLFAPAGGVTNGWQLALRSKNVFGPYEVRKVMHQGNTSVNGPHQGAWVTTPAGDDWFIHFQDKGPYGRIVHLQPLEWVDDWPVIGTDEDGDGTGEPVTSSAAPRFDRPGSSVIKDPVDEFGSSDKPDSPAVNDSGDEFDGNIRPLNWQWPANPSVTWGYPSASAGFYRLNCIPRPDSMLNLWDVPNLFLRKLPAEKFTATASVNCRLRSDGEETGMIVMGRDYQYISLSRSDSILRLRVVRCTDADKGNPEVEIFSREIGISELFFRLTVEAGARCRFSYSTNGTEYFNAGEPFTARQGMWIGAKAGFFALRDGYTNDAGCIDLNWFRILIME